MLPMDDLALNKSQMLHRTSEDDSLLSEADPARALVDLELCFILRSYLEDMEAVKN